MAPYGQVIKETFENEHLRSAMLWLSAQPGPGPDEVAAWLEEYQGTINASSEVFATLDAEEAEGDQGHDPK